MTIHMVHVGRTDDCDDLPAPARVPDPFPIKPPTLLPPSSGEAWQDPATVREIARCTDPTRAELVDLYGTADPDVLRRMPFVLAEDIAAAARYTTEQVSA